MPYCTGTKLLIGWRTELTKPNCASHCWRPHTDRGADRKVRGRQKDVASASRLSSNPLVVFSQHVWVWLMCTHSSEQTENIQTHRPVFILRRSSDFLFRNLNFALVRSQVEPCQSTSVYVEERLYAAWVCYCIRPSRHHPCSLPGPWRLLREW